MAIVSTKRFGRKGTTRQTGQTTSYRTNDDGNLQKGWAVPTTRFVDNSDGTISDLHTGLMWSKSPMKVYPGGSGELSTDKGEWNQGLGSISAGDVAENSYSTWADSTAYSLNQIVYDDFALAYYRCTSAHTSDEANDRPDSGINWTDYWTAHTLPGSTWAADTDYVVGDIAQDQFLGAVYICTRNHKSNPCQPGVDTDYTDYWVLIAAWSDSHGTYNVDDEVWWTDTGTDHAYKCILQHTAAVGKEPDNATYWVKIADNPAGWASDTWYEADDIVSGTFAKCLADHWSNAQEMETDANWSDSWDDGTGMFYCVSGHTAASDKEPPNATYWAVHPFGTSLTVPKALNWNQCVDKTAAITWNGYSDWRLPTINEYLTLIDRESYNAAILSNPFSNLKLGGTDYYLSSTTYKNTTTQAWVILLVSGGIGVQNKTTTDYCLLVRDP